MNPFMKLYCRIYQMAFRIALPILPYKDPQLLSEAEKIIPELKKNHISSVLLVTDSVLRENKIILPLEKALEDSNIKFSVYDKTQPNPSVQNVEEALALYIKHNCTALVAIGGGSSIDCAKAVGARVAYPKKTLSQLKGLLKVLRKIPTLIAIPTTAGTGSEVTPTSVITDKAAKHKYTMNNFSFIPPYAVLDAKLTYTLPKSLTATTGIDALTHAIEAYIGRSTTKQTRALALEATKLIFENIETAYHNPCDHDARSNMLTAAFKAGIAFSKSYVGYIHAVAHSLGGQYNIAHGLANSVLLPVVLEMYGKCAHKKLYELARAAGVCTTSDTYEAGAKKMICAIRKLNNKLDIPEKLSGINKSDIPMMARHAAKEANPLYPVPVLWDADKLEEIYVKVADWS